VRAEGPNTASANKRNRSFYNPHCWPFRQPGRCGSRPNSHPNPYQGLRRHHTRTPCRCRRTSHPVGHLQWRRTTFLVGLVPDLISNVRTNIERLNSEVKRKMTSVFQLAQFYNFTPFTALACAPYTMRPSGCSGIVALSSCFSCAMTDASRLSMNLP
jgi:hypothetical protein